MTTELSPSFVRDLKHACWMIGHAAGSAARLADKLDYGDRAELLHGLVLDVLIAHGLIVRGEQVKATDLALEHNISPSLVRAARRQGISAERMARSVENDNAGEPE
jgi:hypothetical protein